MKRFCLLALTALTLAACGGGGGSSSASTSTPVVANTTATEGLWTGTLTSSVTHVARPVTLLAIASGNMAMFWNNCEQLVNTSSTSNNFFTGAGSAYTPDGSIAACPAVTFPNGTSLATLTVSGEVTSGSSLIGSYTTGGDSGTYNLTYSSAYARVGTLARLVGTYATSGASLTIDANGAISGSISGTAGTTTVTGTATVIDSTKNAYSIALTETVQVINSSSTTNTTSTTGSTSTSNATSTTTTTPTIVNVSGVATLIDSGTGSTNNNLLVSLSNSTTGFMLSLLKQ